MTRRVVGNDLGDYHPGAMTKRALIVDDSRSARVILSRMLEGYGLQVDSSESAEHALEYLRQTRPDVIFMDHLMPGMDGFQAIQAIKGNPDTAMIPVVMYTSQEGELYVSQARALGAVGVLPKTVNEICRGKRGISAEMAWKLSQSLGASPAFWLNLQNNWELSQVKVKPLKKLQLRHV